MDNEDRLTLLAQLQTDYIHLDMIRFIDSESSRDTDMVGKCYHLLSLICRMRPDASGGSVIWLMRTRPVNSFTN